MSARIERAAVVKAEIRKAIDEIEHGDCAAAVNALASGLVNMLEMVIEGDEQLATINEQLAAIRKRK